MKLLRSALKSSVVFQLFFSEDPNANGRRCMLYSSVLSGIIASLTGGIFYSGFLIGHGINIINAGIITFIPFIASFFSIFSPIILERFQQRKKVLLISRALFYAINIGGLTLLPQFVKSDNGKLIGFGLIVFIASTINSLFSSGFSVWHINFLPNSVRADYFSFSNIITNAISGLVVLVSSLIADSLANSPMQLTIITILRIVGLVFAALDIYALARPDEPIYEKSSRQKGKIADIFILPFRNKKYLLTIITMFLYTFASNITASIINIYLLGDVGVTYTFVNGITAVYFLFFLFFGGASKRLIRRTSWFSTFSYGVFFLFPTYILYAFVDHQNYRWLMLIVRLSQHLLSVPITIAYANFPYINLPETDRTNYLAFQSLGINISTLLAMITGTSFIKLMGNRTIQLLPIDGFTFDSVQVLMIIKGILLVLLSLYVTIFRHKMEPEI